MTTDGDARGTASGASAQDEGVGQRIAAAAILIGAGNVLSRVLGLAREQVTAGTFGTGDEIAAFAIAEQAQALLFELAASGMLPGALIPVLAAVAASGPMGRAELRRVGGALLTLVVGVVGVAVILGVVLAPGVVRGMTAMFGSGADRGPETTALTVELVRWILPATLLLAVGTVLMAMLHAIGRVGAAAAVPALRNAAVVGTVVVAGERLGVRSLAFGVVVGSGLIVSMLAWALWQAGSLPTPNFAFGQPAVREAFRLYGPIFVGLVVQAVVVVVDRNLAWGAGEDALGGMRYATTLVQTVLGLVAAAIALAVLPALARLHAAGDEAGFGVTLGRAVAMTSVLMLPAAFGLAALAVPTVDLLFDHGATDAAGARAIVVALLGYLPGTIGAAYGQVLLFAFYARRDTRTPLAVGILTAAVYGVVAFGLVGALGMLGLVLANSAQLVVQGATLWVLARRGFWSMGREVRRVLKICGAAAIGAAAIAAGVWWALAVGLPNAWWDEAALVAAPTAVGATAYVAALRFWRIKEVEMIRRATVGRVRPRVGG